MKNTFGWMQLQTTDVKDSHAFYSELFDWKIEHKGMADDDSYTEIDAGQGPCGGISENTQAPPMWLPFVHVADIEASTTKAENLGGIVLTAPTPIDADMGLYSVIQDPDGAVLGLYQPPQE